MKSTQTKPHQKPDSRKKLLETATLLFAEKGYAGTSVREIVSRAGVTKPVLYYYFNNKEGVYLEILDMAAREQEKMLSDILKKEGTVLERLGYLFNEVYQRLQEHRQLLKMMHHIIFGPPQSAPEYDFIRYHERMVETIKTIYESGVETGEVIDTKPEEAAIMVLSLLDFCLHLDQVHNHFSDVKRPERLLKLAFHGLKKRNEE